MSKRVLHFQNFKIVFQHSRPLTKVVVLAALVLSMTALIVLGIARENAEKRAEEYRAQAAQLEQENSALSDKIDKLGSVDSIQEIAEEELGLFNPDTVIIGSGE